MQDSTIIYTKTFDITKTNSITIQVSNFKWKDLLNIYKSTFSDRYTWIVKNNSIAFQVEQLELLKEIIWNISWDNEIKEFWEVWKYKIYISTYKWNNSFQIREWVESEFYTWYWKKWVSIPMNKFDEFKENFNEVIEYFNKYLNWEIKVEEKKELDDDEIESYF